MGRQHRFDPRELGDLQDRQPRLKVWTAQKVALGPWDGLIVLVALPLPVPDVLAILGCVRLLNAVSEKAHPILDAVEGTIECRRGQLVCKGPSDLRLDKVAGGVRPLLRLPTGQYSDHARVEDAVIVEQHGSRQRIAGAHVGRSVHPQPVGMPAPVDTPEPIKSA